MTFSRTDCDRARASVSAALDGELPELGREQLSAHLSACPDCLAWAAQVEGATRRLRAASLESPATTIALPQRGRRWTVGPAVAVSSAAALVAAVVVAIGPQGASLDSQPAPGTSQSVALADSHPMGGAKVFTGYPVGLANQLGYELPVAPSQRDFRSPARVPA